MRARLKKRKLLAVGVLILTLSGLFFACNHGTPKTTKPSFDKAIHLWIDAHNQRKSDLFGSLYAEKVNYYGEILSRAEVVEDKFGIFETAPDFHKELTSRITVRKVSATVYTCIFYNRTSALQQTARKKKELTFELIHGKWLIVVENGDKTVLPSPAVPAAAASYMKFKYEPNYSAIRGRVAFETFFGEPGFGATPEKDMKEIAPILLTESPINVLATDKDNYSSNVYGVTKVQLISTNGVDFKAYRKKHVRLTGKFFAPETGHHHTKVLMDVEMIEEL